MHTYEYIHTHVLRILYSKNYCSKNVQRAMTYCRHIDTYIYIYIRARIYKLLLSLPQTYAYRNLVYFEYYQTVVTKSLGPCSQEETNVVIALNTNRYILFNLPSEN